MLYKHKKFLYTIEFSHNTKNGNKVYIANIWKIDNEVLNCENGCMHSVNYKTNLKLDKQGNILIKNTFNKHATMEEIIDKLEG